MGCRSTGSILPKGRHGAAPPGRCRASIAGSLQAGGGARGDGVMEARDLSGQRFSHLLVKSRDGSRGKSIMWMCLCDCGSQTRVSGDSLKRGDIKSCGCFRSILIRNARTQHGESSSAGGTQTTEYRIWKGIKARCFNTKVREYKNYGGRGITMHPAWRDDYNAFLRDVGRRPSEEHTIDRIDNNRGYEPDNCRWATSTQQARNTRVVKLSVEAAQKIRARVNSGERYPKIAANFGVSISTIWMVATGKTWLVET